MTYCISVRLWSANVSLGIPFSVSTVPTCTSFTRATYSQEGGGGVGPAPLVNTEFDATELSDLQTKVAGFAFHQLLRHFLRRLWHHVVVGRLVDVSENLAVSTFTHNKPIRARNFCLVAQNYKYRHQADEFLPYSRINRIIRIHTHHNPITSNSRHVNPDDLVRYITLQRNGFLAYMRDRRHLQAT
jgi:hypothetical protein